MTDTHDIASCAAELPGAPALDGAPGQWVHLLTLGTIQGRDGRAWRLSNPEQVLNRFLTGGVDLVVDFEHAVEHPQPKGTPVPAAGWIKQLETRADGIWGLVEWTERAANMVRAKEYRYISPTFLARRDNQEIIALKGAGLVHEPNLHLVALNKTEDPSGGAALARIACALGLPADSLEAEIVTAAARLKATDPGEAVAELVRERNALIEAAETERVAAAVQTAQDRGCITPAMRPWATALCRSDPAAFDTFLKTAGPVFAYLFEPTKFAPLPGGNGALAGETERAVARQLGIDPAHLVAR